MTPNHIKIFFFYLIMLIIVASFLGFHSGKFNQFNPLNDSSSRMYLHSTNENSTHIYTKSSAGLSLEPEGGGDAHMAHRKLLFHGGSCTNRDISISQSKGTTTGIPQYIVQIVNTCVSGCAPSNIHLHCGWFASARMVNPRTFKRISFDDCLVNGGRPLKNSHIISFTYSNSFMYPIAFKNARFCT